MTSDGFEQAIDDSKGNIFVYAGYLKPGKHQIIVYDCEQDKFWAKNIIVDMRKSEVKEGSSVQRLESHISRYKTKEGV